jgi:hypothetical protein
MKKPIVSFIILSLLWCASIPVAALAAAGDSKAVLTKENPLRVNAQEKSVTFLAEVNGKYLSLATRHGIVFSGGKFGDHAVFRGHVSPKDFHNALLKAGGKPGNNMTLENKEKTFVQGDLLEVTVTWADAKRAYGIDEAIIDSAGKPIQVRFGGNIQNALEYKTGCLLCLDSCPVGITSNASYTYGAVEKRNEVTFKANGKVLPPDGTLVMIKVKARK